MTSDLFVRLAQSGDVDTLTQFNIAMAWETERKHLDPATVTQGVRAVIDQPDHGFYVVATHHDDVVGSLLVTFEWSDWRAGLFWWIQSLYVKPEFRRRGVLKKLYVHLKSEASRKPEVCGIRLYAEQSNRVAQDAYTALGMEATGYRVYEELL